jgi:predicted secreted protein
MMNDTRSRKIVYLAHCLLNQNAKVAGLASHPGIFTPILPVLEEAGVGIVQLPCPELVHLGPSRPLGTDTVEQYDTPGYRTCCRDLARRAAEEAASYQEAGYSVVCLLGVEGSPSCSVSRVPRLVGRSGSELRPGEGIFIEALRDQLAAAGLRIPFLGVPESREVGSLSAALARLRTLLGS